MTKDVNLRMKAKSIGLTAENYRSDHVQNPAELYKGRSILEGVDGSQEIVSTDGS